MKNSVKKLKYVLKKMTTREMMFAMEHGSFLVGMVQCAANQ